MWSLKIQTKRIFFADHYKVCVTETGLDVAEGDGSGRGDVDVGRGETHDADVKSNAW